MSTDLEWQYPQGNLVGFQQAKHHQMTTLSVKQEEYTQAMWGRTPQLSKFWCTLESSPELCSQSIFSAEPTFVFIEFTRLPDDKNPSYIIL